MHIKLSSLVSDLLGVSGLRMLRALAEGTNDPAALAALADFRLRATAEQLCDALGACATVRPVYRRLLQMALEELSVIDKHIRALDKEMAGLLQEHQDAVERLARVPGLGVNSAHQIIAEVGPQAAVFPSAKCFSSWIGACPGREESAEESKSSRSPKGNRHMRRILNQAAHAAVKVKGSIFDVAFRRLRLRGLPYEEAIWAIAHRLARLVWLLLRRNCEYQERGPAVTAKSKQARTSRMIRELLKMGYRVEPPPTTAASAQAEA
jgi:transposase